MAPIATYSVNATTGAIERSRLAGSDRRRAEFGRGDASGKYVYVANEDSDSISGIWAARRTDHARTDRQ